MTQYIDKAAVVAEINRQQRKLSLLEQSGFADLRKSAALQNGVYRSLLSFLDSLQVKEVDLDKEIDKWFGEKYTQNMEGLPIKQIVQIISRHFFELGLKVNNDVVVEKASEWLEKNVDKYIWYSDYAECPGDDTCGMNDDFIDDFKNHMKGE